MQYHKKNFSTPFFARGLAQTSAQQSNKMHHKQQSAAQSDSKKVVEKGRLAPALAHNISEQPKKCFFRSSLHLSTHRLSNGRLTLWQWVWGLFSWCGLTSWLLEWKSGAALVGPWSRCRFLPCVALRDLRFLLLFFLALFLLVSIALVRMFTGAQFSCLGLGSSLLLLWGRFLTS